MQYITEMRVMKNSKGRNVWKITRCDEDESCVGEVISCGAPARAVDLPVGAEFRTIFTIPE